MGLYEAHVLPRVIDRTMGLATMAPVRARVAEGLHGEVVEIGFGTGHNLPHLPATITRLLAVEPNPLSVRLAADRIAAAPFEVEVVGLDGQRLPLEDASADAVLCTWALCTIPDAVAAVREMRRVLRPGGRLHFVEHGCSPHPRVRRWQDRLNGIERRVAGGCNLNRDIPALLEAGGFRVVELSTYYSEGTPKPWGWTFEGRAVPA